MTGLAAGTGATTAEPAGNTPATTPATTPADTAAKPAADTPPPDRCPRCGGGFHCGVQGPAPCPCSTLSLAPALQATLRQRYRGCLCLACLQALAAGAEP
ncbi:cysteine-rich CWC family protein [Aquabacterium sp. OR-4]|uniref:cysteine-rich CWC family protein n=1 Tax=Aquabacterium sp. OR-4 TaxID=2978127 RepID=UPI0028C52085|nr:cysteine-rich CWC family protein [Aquabacterium sp. OR-4]MDT7834381.1 cysteine-rich CWC family protein [Aquabacterium sp. OR-4]